MSAPPKDEAARVRARVDHKTSLVLEAGAGTGKTTLLVDRIEAMIRRGTARLEEIAAVTFTENAATTMKLRLRERLERARADPSVPAPERVRAEAALEVLERAPISTIHALCAAMLQERPLECGVSPGFRVADEGEADLLFAEAWEEWLAERLAAGDAVLLEAMDRGIALEGEGFGERSSLRGLARTLLEQRDLEPLVGECEVDPRPFRTELEARASRGLELALQAAPGETLAARLTQLGAHAVAAAGLEGPELLSHLLRLPVIDKRLGHKPRWPSPAALEEARGIAQWTREALQAWQARASSALHGRLVVSLGGVGAIYARRKTEEGLLDFLDLLLKARDALRDRETVRRTFRQRFRALIIDEFQDTDPLQVEIAEALSEGVPGGLVVVGDAKQSIYRFRRAEVSLFRRVSEEAAARSGHAVLHLTQNFRSRPSILRVVNRVFSELIAPSAEAAQTAYEAIEPQEGLPEEPSVLSLRFEAPFASGDDLLRSEAMALAAFVAQAGRGAYEVRDMATGAPRASRAGDLMVLSRRLTQIRHLEEALEAAGIRFTVEGGKSFFDRQEVREVLSCLRALDDPSDRVSLVAALRSSFFGVSDRDIATYVLSGGPLWVGRAEEGCPGAAALAPALGLLGELHRKRTALSVPALLDRLYEDTRILAALFGTRRGEAQAANLEKVATLARQASDLGALTLRGFVGLLEERLVAAREEPDLPSTRPGDPATVRILSIHKAKGLEAPLVALYDSADDLRSRPDVIPLWEEKRVAVGFREGCRPPGWDALLAREESRVRAEGRRLLYVACTRARDFLVIPTPPRDARAGSFWKDLTDRLPSLPGSDVRVVDASTLPLPEAVPPAPDLRAIAVAEGGDAVAARWRAERDEMVASAAHRPFTPLGVLKVAARTAPPPVPGLAPGGGRDFGSLVHRILEWIPFEAGDRAGPMARALAPSFGLDEGAARSAAEVVSRTLALPVISRARSATRAWRELHLWFPEGDELVEGIIDLVFEERDGLVVVDYKTDAIQTEQALAQAAHHAPQLQCYGRGLAQATGARVLERLVLFTALGITVPV